MINLSMFSKLFKIVSKISFNAQIEEAKKQDMLEPKLSYMECFVSNLKSKI